MRTPATVWSVLGTVPVTSVKGLKDETGAACWGLFEAGDREIKLELDQVPASMLSTLMHESMHLAMSDAGVQNILNHEQAEAVCDAIGAYLAGAILAGYLKLGKG